jgi:hypothetical protein
MGLHDFLYRSLQWQTWLKFEIYGNRELLSNPFHWERVKFNLPGSRGYRSDLPWVMKIREDDHLAAEVFEYINDGQATSHSKDLTWRVAMANGSDCSRQGNLAFRDAGALGRHGHPHGGRLHCGNGLPREVEHDQEDD